MLLQYITRQSLINCFVWKSYQLLRYQWFGHRLPTNHSIKNNNNNINGNHRYLRLLSSTSLLRCAHQLTIGQILSGSLTKTVKIFIVDHNDCSSMGTGCIINASKGYVVSCAHAVEDIREATVIYTLANGSLGMKRAPVVYVEPHRELSFIQIRYEPNDQLAQTLTEFKVNDDIIDFGEQCVCLGYTHLRSTLVPINLCITCPRAIQLQNVYSYRSDYSVHSEHISGVVRGFSGGPVVDELGQLAGIHHRTYDCIINCDTPSTELTEFIYNGIMFFRKQSIIRDNEKEDLSESHTLADRHLGIEICWYSRSHVRIYVDNSQTTGQSFTKPVQYYWGNGILIWAIIIWHGGIRFLQDFDIIVKINGENVNTLDDLSRALVASNGKVKVTVIRNGLDFTIPVSTEQMLGSFNIV